MPALSDEVIEAIRERRARLPPAAAGPLRRRDPNRGRGGAGAVRRPDRRPEPRSQRRATRVYRGARPRRAPRAPLARRAAGRLPARRPGRVAAGLGARDRGRASTGARWRCSPRRSSPTSTSSPRSRPRATRRSNRPPPASVQRRRRRLAALLLDPEPDEPGSACGRRGRRLGTAGAGRRARLAPAAGAGCARGCRRTPWSPRPSESEGGARAGRRSRTPPGSAARLERAAAATTADARAAGRRCSAARPAPPAPRACCALLEAGLVSATGFGPRRRSPRRPGRPRRRAALAELAAQRLAPLASETPALARAGSPRPCARGSTTRARSRGSPPSFTCTRRRSATGWRGCATSSATALEDPDGPVRARASVARARFRGPGRRETSLKRPKRRSDERLRPPRAGTSWRRTHAEQREQVIELLKKAYWMEIETVMSYIANSVNPDGVRAQEIKRVARGTTSRRSSATRSSSPPGSRSSTGSSRARRSSAPSSPTCSRPTTRSTSST